jgi:hypothetical protein
MESDNYSDNLNDMSHTTKTAVAAHDKEHKGAVGKFFSFHFIFIGVYTRRVVMG